MRRVPSSRILPDLRQHLNHSRQAPISPSWRSAWRLCSSLAASTCRSAPSCSWSASAPFCCWVRRHGGTCTRLRTASGGGHSEPSTASSRSTARMQPFIATHATAGIMTGIVMTYTDGRLSPQRHRPRLQGHRRRFGRGNPHSGGRDDPGGGAVLVADDQHHLRQERVRRRVNKSAAHNVGINTKFIECSVYIVSGTWRPWRATSPRADGHLQPATAATGGTPVEIVIMAIAPSCWGAAASREGRGRSWAPSSELR
jgi:hypothetical protein